MPTNWGRYRKQDKAKAIAAVVAVHAVLGAALVIGLNVETVGKAVERMRAINITEVIPPIRQPPPPPPKEASAARDEAAPANIRSQPTPVVAPEPQIPLPVEQQIATAEVTGPEGLDRTAGAAGVAGAGTGAGGQGTGFGGGGTGGAGTGAGGGGFTPAQRISKIPDREYRRIVAMSGMRSGRIGLTLLVGTDGRPSNCRIARTSGNPSVDQLFCQLAVQHVRFRPARDPQGRPVASDITWYPDWSPR